MAKKKPKKKPVKKTRPKRKPARRKRGQPTKYKAKYCCEIIDFFDQEPYEDVDLPHYDKDGTTVKWKDKKRMPRKLPTLVQFAKSIKVSYSTVHNWQNPKTGSFHKDFLEAFTRAKELQKDFIIQNGLQGLYNPLFAKFTATNLTDMTDKEEGTGGGGGVINVNIIHFDSKK